MQTPQLLCSMLLVAAATAACNRNDADSQRTAEQVKGAAAKAGHQLADSWLTTKIQAQYFADDDIKARHINVSTRDRMVTLTGYVDGPPQRELAVQIARTTDGVQGVDDRLAINGTPERQRPVATSGATTGTPPAEPETGAAANAPPQPFAPDDGHLTARVYAKLFTDPRVKGRQIDVATKNGVVTLTGEVGDEDERSQVLLLARTTEGVARVEDNLTVAPYSPPPASSPASPPAAAPIDDSRLTTTIQARFFVDPTVKASAIEVSAKDGVVQLRGGVPSEAVRKQALAIAGNTEGVAQVIDRLTVAPAKR